MKRYPSIPRSSAATKPFDATLFAKLDGSNVRVEWERKGGYLRYGTRHHLLERSDPVLGGAITLFERDFAEALERMARDERFDGFIAYLEFYGPSSFAGQHVAGERKSLALFDLDVHRRGLLPPTEYLRLVGSLGVPQAAYIGQARWTPGLVERVRTGSLPGASFEGVVGKGVEGRKIIMAKAKTQAWIDAVRARYATADAERLIES